MKGARGRLILASASPRRAELLRGMGVDFEVIASRAEELEDGKPAEVALTNACRKAMALAEAHPNALVLAADTVVALGKKMFGKPANTGEARQMLRALSGKTHDVITGVCLLRLSPGDVDLFAETTRVTFRRLTAAAIAAYVRDVHVLDKAGGYAIQEKGDTLVKKIEGSFTNVVGLPVERLQVSLARRMQISARPAPRR